MAVSRWIAGEGIEVAIEVGRETWEIFAELAAQRAATLEEVTRRCFAWRNVMAEVLHESAAELDVGAAALSEALNILQLSLEFSLLRMCECFEAERALMDEQLGRREEELSFLATHDPLTGLPNRTLILDRVEQMLARSARSQTPVAALFVDLDNFKSINDTLGHIVGDELVQAVAARLDGVIRGGDTLGRLGGDEFVMISEELTLGAGPDLIAERLLEALAPPFKLGAEEQTRVTVTASIGIAAGDRIPAEELLRNADIAMYRAKWDGKNRYAVFETDMQDTMQNRMELEMDLREALEKKEFLLAYQPTIDLNDMNPTAVEALIRWKHPTRGIVQPNDFLLQDEDCDTGQGFLFARPLDVDGTEVFLEDWAQNRARVPRKLHSHRGEGSLSGPEPRRFRSPARDSRVATKVPAVYAGLSCTHTRSSEDVRPCPISLERSTKRSPIDWMSSNPWWTSSTASRTRRRHWRK